jgi:hypothetical protein
MMTNLQYVLVMFWIAIGAAIGVACLFEILSRFILRLAKRYEVDPDDLVVLVILSCTGIGLIALHVYAFIIQPFFYQ